MSAVKTVTRYNSTCIQYILNLCSGAYCSNSRIADGRETDNNVINHVTPIQSRPTDACSFAAQLQTATSTDPNHGTTSSILAIDTV